ncbi:MAG: hypothetical protein KF859_02655 [Phycisphaeraceae bacterium]|nr:hypothetical protein [Phycisphaeraceae bacterium]
MTTDTSTPAVPAPPAPRGWGLSVLLEPAAPGVSCDIARRVWRSIACGLASDALSAVIRHPVEVHPDRPRDAMIPAWGLEFACGGASLRLLLDANGARAMADAASRSLIGLRGAGPLTSAEHAVLEYLALETLDHLAAMLPGSRCAFGRTLTGDDLPDLPRAGPVEAWVGVRAGAREGTGALLVSGVLPALPPTLAPNWNDAGPSATTAVHLALPGFFIHAEERRTLAPGDVVLCGVSDLTAAPGCMVATPTLWGLCHAQVTEHGATSFKVTCGPWSPAPLTSDALPRARGVSSATVLLGRAGPAPLSTLGACIAAGAMEFANDPAGGCLIIDGRLVARGEMVRCDGEIGLRLLDMMSAVEGGG